jgi:hypothetical protein
MGKAAKPLPGQGDNPNPFRRPPEGLKRKKLERPLTICAKLSLKCFELS